MVATYGWETVRRVVKLWSVSARGRRSTRPNAGSAATVGRPDEVLDLDQGHRRGRRPALLLLVAATLRYRQLPLLEFDTDTAIKI